MGASLSGAGGGDLGGSGLTWTGNLVSPLVRVKCWTSVSHFVHQSPCGPT